MIDAVFIVALIAFFALMVAFVHWCERIVGKEDVAITDGGDDEVPADPTGDRSGPDTDTPIDSHEEVPA